MRRNAARGVHGLNATAGAARPSWRSARTPRWAGIRFDDVGRHYSLAGGSRRLASGRRCCEVRGNLALDRCDEGLQPESELPIEIDGLGQPVHQGGHQWKGLDPIGLRSRVAYLPPLEQAAIDSLGCGEAVNEDRYDAHVYRAGAIQVETTVISLVVLGLVATFGPNLRGWRRAATPRVQAAE
jgi:hypothetical protein